MGTRTAPTSARGRRFRLRGLLVLSLWCLAIGLIVSFPGGLVHAERDQDTKSTESAKKKRRDLSHLRIADLHALVVGVSTYSNPKIPSLKLAAKDATDFAKFLTSQKDLFKNVHIKLLVNEQAIRGEIEKFLLYDVRNAGRNDSVILYFSGHGAIDPRRGGEYFFVTYDTDPNYLGASGVLMSCNRFFKGLEARHVLVVADTCHAGSFSDMQTKSIAGSLESFMKEFRGSSGRVIMASSKPDEYSLEVPGLENGVFTHFLLEALQGAADKNRDGVVSIREAYDYIYAKTKDVTKGAQHPQFEGKVVGSFPVSARPPGGTLEVVTKPPIAEVYVRDEVSFKLYGKTDSKGRLAIEDLPLKEPIIVMVKKTGWKDRVLDPLVFSRKELRIGPETIRLEPALAFLLLRTGTPGIRVSVAGKEIGTIGENNFLIVDDVQVGIPHEVRFRKEGYEEQKVTISIPPSFEGKVYQSPLVDLKKKAAVAGTRKPGASSEKTDSLGKARADAKPSAGGRKKTEPEPMAVKRELQKKLIARVRAGSVEEVKKLLSEGGDANGRDELGWSVLMHACSSGRKEVARLLIENGANVNARDRLGWTPLMVAAGKGHEDMVRLLLEKGADKSASNVYGDTAKTRASAGRHTGVLTLLGVEVGSPPGSEQPAEQLSAQKNLEMKLFEAARAGDMARVKKLLTEGAGVNARDELDWTSLMHACSKRQRELAKFLLFQGADVNAHDRLGWTPLMIAAGNGDAQLVKLLLEKGADRDARNVYGETAGIRAAVGKHVQVMKMLGTFTETRPTREAPRGRNDRRVKRERPERPRTSDEPVEAASAPNLQDNTTIYDFHYTLDPRQGGGPGGWK